MNKSTRDDFPMWVKRTLAQRVNGRCSNPNCGAPTSGPTADPLKHSNIGVAAHITAAARGGPRYNANLTKEQRQSPDNGIWLCRNCGTLTDNDSTRFPEHVLREWKRLAEANAREQLGKRSPFDRTDAPTFEILPTKSVRSPSSTIFFSPSASLIQEIIDGFPDFFRGAEQTEVLSSGLGALGHRYAILGLGANHGWDWSILFFTAGEFGWELVARTSLESQKAYIPEALYVLGVPGALALTHLAGWGTGVLRRSTSWYRIARNEPVPLFSYPHNFYVVGWGMPFKRELTSTLLKIPIELTEGALLDLRFQIEYSIVNESTEDIGDTDLFSTVEVLSLEWSEKAQTFLPHTTKDDFAKIENLWNEDTAMFVKRNKSRLQELAEIGTERQRRFIKEHLLQ
jgi:hypothetical protein